VDVAAPLIPPRPAPPAKDLGGLRFFAAMRTNILEIWPQAAYEQDFHRQRVFGRESLLLNAADAIQHVLVANAENYRRTAASTRILRPIVGRGLLLAEGDEWRFARRTIAPAMAPRVIPMLAAHIATVAAEWVERLRLAPRRPLDLLAEMQALALEIAGRSMFSLAMATHAARLRALITRFGERLAAPHMLDLLLPLWLPTLRDWRRQRFRQDWLALIGDIMAERRAMSSPDEAPRDLFDLLRAARDPVTGLGFSDAQLADHVSTLIVAGHETTALALFWSLTLLAHSPADQRHLADEAVGTDLAPQHAGEALARLPFTRAVVSEALRLYPPAFAFGRQALAADVAGGIDIAAGTTVLIAPWVLHRHRRLWRDPDRFDPSRFMPEAPAVPRFSYLPFGAGPRVCVGAQFAMAEATLALAALVRAFRFNLDDIRPPLPVGIVTTQPDFAPFFSFWPR
jgi:unspecific monooxygenase